jgi:hypothetical protein
VSLQAFANKDVVEDGIFSRIVAKFFERLTVEFNALQKTVAANGRDISQLEVIGTTLTVSVADASVGGWVTGTPKNVGSLQLPAGMWLVMGEGHFAGSVTGTDLLWQLSTTSGAFESINGHSPSTCAGPAMPSAASDIRSPMAPRVVASVAPNLTTVFALARIAFTAGTPLAGCGIRAVRLA